MGETLHYSSDLFVRVDGSFLVLVFEGGVGGECRFCERWVRRGVTRGGKKEEGWRRMEEEMKREGREGTRTLLFSLILLLILTKEHVVR